METLSEHLKQCLKMTNDQMRDHLNAELKQKRIDEFACAAISGVLANPNFGSTSEQDAAWYAYSVAEYMEKSAQSASKGKTMTNDIMNVIGIDKQGKHVDMGLALITPETKAEQISTSYFGGSVEDDGSEASMMYGGLLEMLTWLRNTGQLQGGLKPVRKAYICTHCKAVYADEPVAQCACLPEGEKQEFTEASIVGGGVWKR